MEKVTLSAEELKQLHDLKKSYDEIVITLGQLDVQKHFLQEKIEKITTEQHNHHSTIVVLQQKEEEIGKVLTDKYGSGDINIETGEFTSIK